MTPEFKQFLEENGNFEIRELPDGTVCTLMRLMFTVALCIDATEDQAYRKRFCFENLHVARAALRDLKDKDDEPTGWIARRPKFED